MSAMVTMMMIEKKGTGTGIVAEVGIVMTKNVEMMMNKLIKGFILGSDVLIYEAKCLLYS